MGFPGRLHEKRKISKDVYIIAAVVITIIGFGVWEVVKAIRAPLTQEQKKELYVEKKGGNTVAQKKVNNFSSDVNQILHGDPLKHAPVKPDNGSAVVYAAPQPVDQAATQAEKEVKEKPPADYYSDQKR